MKTREKEKISKNQKYLSIRLPGIFIKLKGIDPSNCSVNTHLTNRRTIRGSHR